jgi:DNA modification methylase
MEVELREIDKVIPYVRNPRQIPERTVELVAASIQEFGFRQPIVTDEKSVVIVGHARLLAAQRLGMETVPVHVAVGLTDAQARAYRLMDNRSAQEAQWDKELLGFEFMDLREMNFDLTLTGFTDEEIGELDPVKEGKTDPDAVPEVEGQAVTQQSDLWVLGDHRVLCGDATSAGHVDGLMGAERPAMVFTDPPYGIGLTPKKNYASRKENKQSEDYAPIRGDDVHFDCEAMMRRVVCPVWYVWGADYFFDTIPDYNKGSLVVWTKRMSEEESEKVFGSAFEICWRFPRKKKVVWFERAINQSSERMSVHPTQKPTALAVRALADCATGDIVADFYIGSGSTLIACEQLSRRCYGIEIEPRYVDVTVRRWQDFTGKDAVLDGDGRTFNEIESNRIAEGGGGDASGEARG